MSEASKALTRPLYGERLANGDISVANEIFHPDFLITCQSWKLPIGVVPSSVEATCHAFPDIKLKIIAEIAEGEWLTIAVYADGGTHPGRYIGVPATGRPVTRTETLLSRVVGGLVKEHYGNVSMFEIHVMLGSHDLQDKLN